ncbi:universal stress protein [Cohnella fermenti]|uniref:Universal stress protein n=1 Tax=Cohnella fermenti TaxID=2565925 RepID=A0A4S4BWF4_9BACL|nr:universal stress protein [Cohnella fermenti]THF79488.1 universal stress protein [Cohnella fermenti]
MSYSHILVAYDGSGQSDKALNHAVQIASRFGSKLTVAHVFYLPIYNSGDLLINTPADLAQQLTEQSSKVLEKAKVRVPDSVAAEYKLLEGSPALAILDLAEELQNDLIVIGSRGLGPIREFVLGSVSHNVVQHAECPVMIVK